MAQKQFNVNRLIAREVDSEMVEKTPYEWIHGHKPDVRGWLPVGATVVGHLSSKNGKDGPRAVLGVHLGIAMGRRAYRVLVGDKVYQCSTVRLVEGCSGRWQTAMLGVKHGIQDWIRVARRLELQGLVPYDLDLGEDAKDIIKEEQRLLDDGALDVFDGLEIRDAAEVDDSDDDYDPGTDDDGDVSDGSDSDGDVEDSDSDRDADDDPVAPEQVVPVQNDDDEQYVPDREEVDEDEEEEEDGGGRVGAHAHRYNLRRRDAPGGIVGARQIKVNKDMQHQLGLVARIRATRYAMSLQNNKVYLKANPEAPKIIKNWKLAMEDELHLDGMKQEKQAWDKNHVYESVKLSDVPAGAKLLWAHWVFVPKWKDGKWIVKARLVVDGSKMECKDTYAPTVDRMTVFSTLVMAVQRGWAIRQADFSTAFLNGKREEPVYVKAPYLSLANGDPDSVCKIVGNVYGLPDAPRIWYNTLKDTLDKFGFKPTHTDAGMFVYEGEKGSEDEGKVAYMCIYVDDVVFTGNDEEFLDRTLEKINEVHKLKVGKLDKFLGINFTRKSEDGPIHACLEDTVLEMLNEWKLFDSDFYPSKTLKLPTMKDAVPDPTEKDEPMDVELYQTWVGKLTYLMSVCRPDLAKAVNVLCSHLHHPCKRHFRAVKQVFRYVAGTPTLGISLGVNSRRELHGDSELVDYSSNLYVAAFGDADWGTDPNTRKSYSGFVIMFNGSIVGWGCKRQTVVALSTVQAEYIAAGVTVRKMMHLSNVFEEANMHLQGPLRLFCDNLPAIRNASNPDKSMSAIRHTAISHHFISDEIARGKLQMLHVSSKLNGSDPCTKLMSGPVHKHMCAVMGMVERERMVALDKDGNVVYLARRRFVYSLCI
jgi:hypothetical protein